MPLYENGGYFVLRPEIFDHLPENGDLIADACMSLASEGRMLAYRHRGFWHPADTVKERTALEALYRSGTARGCSGRPSPRATRCRPQIVEISANEHER